MCKRQILGRLRAPDYGAPAGEHEALAHHSQADEAEVAGVGHGGKRKWIAVMMPDSCA
jgi:hypothetical protein